MRGASRLAIAIGISPLLVGLTVVAFSTSAPELPIIARVATRAGLGRLAEREARDVIHPELEGGLEVVRHTLLTLGYPLIDVQSYTEAVRRDNYDAEVTTAAEQHELGRLVATVRGMEIAWLSLPEGSPLTGRSLAESNIRAKTEASVIAVLRDRHVLPNSKSALIFRPRM